MQAIEIPIIISVAAVPAIEVGCNLIKISSHLLFKGIFKQRSQGLIRGLSHKRNSERGMQSLYPEAPNLLTF